jgi:serine/threonine protein kinase
MSVYQQTVASESFSFNEDKYEEVEHDQGLNPKLIHTMVFNGDLQGEVASRSVFVKVLNMIKRIGGEKLLCHSDVMIDRGVAKMIVRGYVRRPLAPETTDVTCTAETMTVKQEVFEAGVLLFHMVTRHIPFQEASLNDWWYKQIINGNTTMFWRAHDRNGQYSAAFKNLIERMLDPNPRRRITLSEIEAHPWMM